MPLYAALANGNPNNVDITNWPNTLGGRIKKRATLRVTNVLIDIGMKNLLDDFTHVGWGWNPNVAGRSEDNGRNWLDRQVPGTGECGYPGWGLYVLLTAPKPWGFGVNPMHVAARVYSGLPGGAGNNGDGFIADHVGLHHGLSANICDPAAPLVLSPLRWWGDHVVVEYLNRFWDPSYNKSYAAITDMAHYRVVGDAFNPAIGYAMEFTDLHNPLGQNVWFRTKTHNDVGFHPQCTWIGPYANNPIG